MIEPTTLLTGQIMLAARRTGSGGGQAAVWLLLAVVVIGGVCGALYVFNRKMQAWRTESSGGLFQGLCKAHALNRNSRQLLKQLAAANHLTQPARVFTEPRWLESAKTKPDFRSKGSLIADVQNRLFGTGKPLKRAKAKPRSR